MEEFTGERGVLDRLVVREQQSATNFGTDAVGLRD